MRERVQCQRCGALTLDGGFCTSCGRPLPPPSLLAPIQRRLKAIRKRLAAMWRPLAALRRPPVIAIAVAAFLAVEIIAAIAMHSSSNGKPTRLASVETTSPFTRETTLTTEAPATTPTVAETSTSLEPSSTTTTTKSKTVVTAAPTPPSTTRACPSARPEAHITSFMVTGHADGTDAYDTRVEGTVTNNTGEPANVGSVSYSVYRDDVQVDSGLAYVNRILAPGETYAWANYGSVNSPGGTPTSAQVTNVSYTWAGGCS